MAAEEERGPVLGDLWGGLGAMLVALPSAIAFGVAVMSPLGGSHAAEGALAGMLGVTALGLVAPALGGTRRLISAPCAPAAAVLSAFALERSASGLGPEAILVRIALVAFLAGLLQILFGLAGIGRLIKYMPYPVVSGYLTGVGFILVASQLPRLLGVPKGTSLGQALVHPALWSRCGATTGVMTAAVVLAAPRLTRAVPAAILGLLAGGLTYLAFAAGDPTLLRLDGNHLVVGSLGGSGLGFLAAVGRRFGGLHDFGPGLLPEVLVPGATLAVLLSIDTLKTCLVLDAMTRSRHDSNRELIGQGVANVAAAALGGLPGAGTMGATLVNISSGGRTRFSGLIEGALSLLAFLLLGGVMAWVPLAALAGILIVVGLRMVDWHSFTFLRNRSTLLDFLVIAAVVVVAEAWSLIAASAVGVGIAVLLFLREQVSGSVVHRRSQGDRMSSRMVRLPAEMEVLRARGSETGIVELQGSLFFGTADQLYRALEPEAKVRRRVIVDLERVQSVDLTAAHVLELIEDLLAERQGTLVFSAVKRRLPGGRSLQGYFDEVGLTRAVRPEGRVFEELDQALEWAEDRVLEESHLGRPAETPLELAGFSLCEGRKEETLADLEARLEQRSFRAGERIFAAGDPGDELFLVRRGAVRIVLPLADGQRHHVATFGRGSFFGEMAFLGLDVRSADAIAFTDVDVYVLSRPRFDELAEHHKRLAGQLLGGIARALAIRLRHADGELRALKEPGER